MSRIPIRITKPTKYKAVRTDGYASKKEAKRAAELELLEKLGEISGLQKQIRYGLIPKDEIGPLISYVADFVYRDLRTGKIIVEDVKGFRTPLYRLKKRLMFTVQGVRITEI